MQQFPQAPTKPARAVTRLLRGRSRDQTSLTIGSWTIGAMRSPETTAEMRLSLATGTAVAATALSLFAALFGLAVHTAVGQRIDQQSIPWAGYWRLTAEQWVSWLLPLCLVLYLLVCLSALHSADHCSALIRTHGLLLVSAAIGVTAKRWLPRPTLSEPVYLTNSYPSGTVLAVAALCAALLIVAPATVRLIVLALGILSASATGFIVLALGWHRLSDVVGALLIVTMATASAVVSRPRRGTTAHHSPEADPVARCDDRVGVSGDDYVPASHP